MLDRVAVFERPAAAVKGGDGFSFQRVGGGPVQGGKGFVAGGQLHLPHDGIGHFVGRCAEGDGGFGDKLVVAFDGFLDKMGIAGGIGFLLDPLFFEMRNV